MSHLNNACAILSGRKQIIRVSTTISDTKHNVYQFAKAARSSLAML